MYYVFYLLRSCAYLYHNDSPLREDFLYVYVKCSHFELDILAFDSPIIRILPLLDKFEISVSSLEKHL